MNGLISSLKKTPRPVHLTSLCEYSCLNCAVCLLVYVEAIRPYQFGEKEQNIS